MNPAPLTPASAPYGVVGRYAIFDEIASGGMATVHLGKLAGAGGFSRVVAIKRLHPQFSKDAEFSAMFMDEARLAARIHHPNVVQTLDVVVVEKELLLVMEYVHGMSFASLLGAARRAGQRVEPRIVAGVIAGALEGLHAAHEAKSEVGVPLGVVHRDVSPQNVLIGVEGVPRILDFGVAKAIGKMHETREGQLKGKLAYMSPEQVRGHEVTRQSDIFSLTIVLWEALMGERLFDGSNPAELIMQVLSEPIAAPRSRFPDLPPELDDVVMKGLARDTATRYATARDMAVALEAAVGLSPSREIARWIEAMAGDTLRARSQLLEGIERAAAAGMPPAQGDKAPASPRADPAYDISSERGRAVESGTRTRPDRTGGSVRPAGEATPVPISPLLPPSSGPASPARQAPADPVPRASGLRPIEDSFGAPRPTADPLAGSASRPRAATPAGLAGEPWTPSAAPSPSASSRPRPHRVPIPVEPDENDHISLRERLEMPLKVVVAGVLLSLVDMAVRPFTASLPIRPLWVAEILVVAGVLWALARLVLPRSGGSRDSHG